MQRISVHGPRAGTLAKGLFASIGAGLIGLSIAVAQPDESTQPRMGILMWGDNAHGQCDVPAAKADLKHVQIACGTAHTLALQSNGQLCAWGLNDHGQLDIPVLPPGVTFQRVAASDHNLALASDGSIVAWGRNDFGQCNVPSLPAEVVWSAVSAGASHSAALSSDGAIYCWGDNSFSQCDVPKPPLGMSYVAVSAGARHTVALRSDGHVVCWGDNQFKQAQIPGICEDVQFVAIWAGGSHTLALTASGRLVAWGSNESNQCVVPPVPLGRRYVDAAAGGRHSIGLLDDGSILCWGANDLGQSSPPKQVVNFEVVRIAAGMQHSAALYHSYPADIEPICLGNGAPEACPCRNEAPPDQVSGCLNSSKQGGRLAGTGQAKILEDSLSFLVSGLPPSIAVILQSPPDPTGGAGGQHLAPFGDGLFCLHGKVLRLGSINAAAGAFVFPDIGTAPLSVLGGIGAPREVNYQVWFRDPHPVCKGDGSNTTNALRVLWSL